MKYSPSAPQTSKNYIWAISALIAVCIGFFVTYDLYASMASLSDEITTLKVSQSTVAATLTSLEELDTASKDSPDAVRYIGSPRDDKIFEQIFSLSSTGSQIGAVSIDAGELLTSGITQASISLALETDNLQSLLGFIDRATATDAPRRFVIKSLSFAYDRATANLPITATIQLWAYTTAIK